MQLMHSIYSGDESVKDEEILKNFRDFNGVSRQEQADLLGISLNTLNNWEYRSKGIPAIKSKHVEYVLNSYNNLSKSQKLNKIINHVKDEGISAYSISKATNISEAGLGKILNKVSKNPQERTVDVIYNYLFKEGITEEIKEVKEFKTLNIDAKLDELHNLLQTLTHTSKDMMGKINDAKNTSEE